MTGFGSGSAEGSGRQLKSEIKSLNSKQLDLIVKLPVRYRQLESEVRGIIAAKADRGKIELCVCSELIDTEAEPIINVSLMAKYKRQIESLDKELGLPGPQDWHALLFRMPDAMKVDDCEITDSEKHALLVSVEKAVMELTTFRKEEGRKLRNFFAEKIVNIERLLAEVEPFEEGRVAKIKSRLYEQLEKLNGVEVDKGRLEQELIYYIEKLDISEEKQRLSAHLDYFMKTMDSVGEEASPIGKKLGFIAQEMGREINTLGSKSNNAEMQIIVVQMKDELEQIKEQVLNVL